MHPKCVGLPQPLCHSPPSRRAFPYPHHFLSKTRTKRIPPLPPKKRWKERENGFHDSFTPTEKLRKTHPGVRAAPARGGAGPGAICGGRRCGGSASSTPPFRAPSPLSAAARLRSIPTPQPLPPHPRFLGPAHPRLSAVRRCAARICAGRERRSRSAAGAAVPSAAVRSRYGPAALSPLRRSAPPPARPGPAHRGGNGAAGGSRLPPLRQPRRAPLHRAAPHRAFLRAAPARRPPQGAPTPRVPQSQCPPPLHAPPFPGPPQGTQQLPPPPPPRSGPPSPPSLPPPTG